MSSVELESGDTAAFAAVVVVFSALYVFSCVAICKSCRVVRQSEVMILERFGRYHKTLQPGFHFTVPFVDEPREVHWRYVNAENNVSRVVAVTTDRIDMREHVIDFGRQHVITKDTVQIQIDALLYFRITDPRVAVFKVQNLPDAIELLTQATLRNIVAQMTLDDTFSSREAINAELLSKIARDCERWGVTVTRVEIFNILPPGDIRNAMENQIRSERERRSTVLHADGERESAIIRSRGDAAKIVLTAEGRRAADLLRAKGEAQAKVMAAVAEAKSISAIMEAVKTSGVRAVDYLTAVGYLDALRSLTGKATSPAGKAVLVPVDAISGISEIVGMNVRQ